MQKFHHICAVNSLHEWDSHILVGSTCPFCGGHWTYRKVADYEPDETIVHQTETVRTFDTGATRDLDRDKLDFEGFNCPLVEQSFAEYMHKNRFQTDGNYRDSDNWQRGITHESYVKSLCRHFQDVRLHHRGYGHMAKEDMITALNAMRFNVNGLLHELLKS